MRKVLIVAYYFPPLSTSGCMRPMAFCKYLPDHGWEPAVLTVVPETADPELARDPALLNGLPTGMSIRRAPDENLLARIGRVRRSARRAPSAGSQSGVQPAPPGRSTVRQAVGTGLRMLFAFPDNCAGWLRPAIGEGLRMAAEIKPDLVLATAPPWTGLLVGAAIARGAGVPFVADFRDPWTAQERRYADMPGGRRRAARLEARTVREASRVIANTVPAADWLAAKYPAHAQKIVAIPNGFDSELVQGTDVAPAVVPGVGPLELCHFGTVYAARSPRQLLLALADLAERHNGASGPPVRVRFIGAWQVNDSETRALTERLERSGLMVREAPLPHAACLRAMRDSRALLILQPDLPLQIPGKLYEYIAAGRPLVVVGGEGATASLVTSERLGVCCADNREAIRELLGRLAAGGGQLPEPDAAVRHRFEYRALAGRLASTLELAAGA